MTHADLCRLTAEWAIKPPSAANVALYEYQSYASFEYPDVLAFCSNGTELYEIKMSRADFRADGKKEAREPFRKTVRDRYGKYFIEQPHLGRERSFVCESGLIEKHELPEGWGLVWFSGGRFRRIAKSGVFRPDVRTERNIVTHALRRYASGDQTGILVRRYDDER